MRETSTHTPPHLPPLLPRLCHHRYRRLLSRMLPYRYLKRCDAVTEVALFLSEKVFRMTGLLNQPS